MERPALRNASIGNSSSRSFSKWSIRDRSKESTACEKLHAISPDYAYKNTKMTLRQLQAETNKPSSEFHDLREDIRCGHRAIGSLKVEVLQCVGLPKLDALGETDAYCLAVCGAYAFRTDTIPENADPRWLSKMRRACIFPIFKGYERLFVGVFDADAETDRDDFAGRTVLDLSRLRPNSSYDIVLPLRESAHVYMKRPRGAVRLRIVLEWKDERAMVLSYLPRISWKKRAPNVTVACADKKAFQSIALTAHGTHMPGRFSMKLLRSIIREVSLTQIHVLRYLRIREIHNLRSWKTPLVSAYVFCAWMHGVYWNTPRYVPGHFVSFVLLRLWQNYMLYAIDEPFHRGFLGPTFEEIVGSLLFGKNMIAPLEFKPKRSSDLDLVSGNGVLDDVTEAEIAHERAAEALNEVTSKRRRGRQTFLGSDAVSLLVGKGLAENRIHAVSLCQALMTDLVFESTGKSKEFRDDNSRYHFTVPSRSTSAKTHRPWGTRLLWSALGPSHSTQMLSERAEEMPFAPSSEYPRRRLEDSFVPRSKGLSLMGDNVEDEEFLGLHTSDSDDDRSDDGILLPSGSGRSCFTDFPQSDSSSRLEYLAKPPPQDIDTRARTDKPVSAVLRDLRDKVHTHLLYIFEEKAYELQLKPRKHPVATTPATWSPRKLKRSVSFDEPGNNRMRAPQFIHQRRSSLRQVAGTLSELTQDLPTPESTRRRSWSSDSLFRPQRTNQTELPPLGLSSLSGDLEPVGLRRRSWSSEDTSELKARTSWAPNTSTRPSAEVEYTKEGLDRLLKTGMNSTSNPWVSKMGVLLQPMIEMALAGLSLFRSLHNLFTWRDPVLSVWFSLIGICLVIILHLFPWRLASFLAGVALVGPQNWVLRKIRERKGIPEPPMDVLIHKPRREQQEVDLSGPPFSFKNISSNDTSLSQSNYKYRHVVVPHSQLMFSHRFYEWPPDPRYSRVTDSAREEESMKSAVAPRARVQSLLAGNAESHWASQFMSLDKSDSSHDTEDTKPVMTFSLASGHYRSKND